MRVIKENRSQFFKGAVGIAEHYGFGNVDEACGKVTKKKGRLLDLHQHKTSGDHFDQHVLSNILDYYTKDNELQKRQPLLFYTPSLVTKSRASQAQVSALTLSAIGADDPLIELVMLRAATSILGELGITKYKLRVNSIGDSDSSARFIREVLPLLRERTADLPPKYAEKMRDNPEMVLARLFEERHPIVADLPSPLNFLTTPSRKHFKELLELLENSDLPFELDDRLYGDHRMYSHSIFEIVEQSDEENTKNEVLARGGRYDTLTKKYVQSAVPAVGIVLAFQTKDQTGPVGRPNKRRPKACLVHIGREARIRSISIIETFRKEKIPVELCLQYERFSEQLEYAQGHKTKYVIIIGQREAHNNVVIVRNSADRSQETVPIDSLPQYLRAAV